MRFRNVVLVILSAALALGWLPAAAAQQSQLSPTQRLDVMRSRLDTMRRTLNSAIAGLNAKDTGAGQEQSADDPRARLGGLEKEASRLLGEVADIRGKVDRSERYDTSALDRLEVAVTDLDNRTQAAMRDTARDRTATHTAQAASKQTVKKKGGGFFSHIIPFHGGGGSKYDALVGTVGPGRDRELFEVATKEARHDNYEEARSLYAVIINT